MSTDSTTDDNVAIKPVSKSAWKKSAEHVIRLNAGEYVKIRIPDLPAMVESGQIPQHLLEVALGTITGQQPEPSVELVKQQREFTDNLVRLTVIEPALDESDMNDIPYEDKELIVDIATRQRDLDAEGTHISGMEKSEKFRRFRKLGEFREDVAGL